MSYQVIMRGPLFDGRAEQAAQEACDAAEKQVAVLGAQTTRAMLDQVLRVQTPYYRLRVQARPDPPGWKISDAGVIYGPWLEGTGSRNWPVTRFRGYATFRRATQVIRAQAHFVADAVVARFMHRMN